VGNISEQVRGIQLSVVTAGPPLQDDRSSALEVNLGVPERKQPSKKPGLEDPSDPRHGTTNGYGNLGCRCERCRAANTMAHRELLARYRAEGGRGEHGTIYRYATGCRCRACLDASAADSSERKRRRRERRRRQRDEEMLSAETSILGLDAVAEPVDADQMVDAVPVKAIVRVARPSERRGQH
jgi:hypothetical protein